VLAAYAPRAHQPLTIDGFEAKRFRRLLENFVARRIAVYVLNAPYYDPDRDQYPESFRSQIRRVISREVGAVRGATLLPDFASDCSQFFDTVHLNRKGGEQFTEYLRTRVL
jgi:hypothetical protein